MKRSVLIILSAVVIVACAIGLILFIRGENNPHIQKPAPTETAQVTETKKPEKESKTEQNKTKDKGSEKSDTNTKKDVLPDGVIWAAIDSFDAESITFTKFDPYPIPESIVKQLEVGDTVICDGVPLKITAISKENAENHDGKPEYCLEDGSSIFYHVVFKTWTLAAPSDMGHLCYDKQYTMWYKPEKAIYDGFAAVTGKGNEYYDSLADMKAFYGDSFGDYMFEFTIKNGVITSITLPFTPKTGRPGNSAYQPAVLEKKQKKTSKTSGKKDSELTVYQPVLDKYAAAVHENWDFEKKTEKGVYIDVNEYGQMIKLGYMLKDLNGDGVSELIIGASDDGYGSKLALDLYTISKGKLQKLSEAGPRERHFITSDGCLFIEGSAGAANSVASICRIEGSGVITLEEIESNDGSCTRTFYDSSSGERKTHTISQSEYNSYFDDFKAHVIKLKLTPFV